MKSIPVFDLSAQYQSIKPQIDQSIAKILKQTAFINGKANAQFNEAFAKFLKVKYCVSVGSGSVALDLALLALEIGPGDEVICPSHTFAATAEAIVHCGATPVFVDIDERTYNINTKLVADRITKNTKAIIPVHLYGQPVEMGPLMKLAKKNQLKVVEDAAQAHGAKYQDRFVGGIGDISIFSFFPAKNLGCFGDGGAIVTNNEKLAKTVDLLKDHGRISKYEHKIIGYGERLDNLQAAILLVKLKHLNRWNKRRQKIAKQYDTAFKNLYITPFVYPEVESVYYVYTLRHPQRDKIRKYLAKKGIDTGIYYPKPLHLQQSFEYLSYKKGDLPITERIASEIFSIPIYPELSDQQVEYIIDCVTGAHQIIS